MARAVAPALLLLLISKASALGLEPHQYAERSRRAELSYDAPIAGLEELTTGGKWFNYSNQAQDHFDPTNTATWNQQYYVDDTHATKDGPVFMYLGGEGPGPLFLMEVQMKKWAAEFNATYILLEHRYYGKSSPVADFSTPNMRYLTAGQALEDAAQFLTYYNSTLPVNRKWMIFGCSYSGTLSSWFRLRYPNLVVGSYGPSGPNLAQSNFTGYFEQFARTAGPKCADKLRRGTKDIQMKLMEPGGPAMLGQLFNSCKPITSPADMYQFKWTVGVTLAGMAQEDLPPYFIVKMACGLVEEAPTDMQAVVSAFHFATGDSSTCNDYSEAEMIASMKMMSPQANVDGARAWFWQKCTEFGYFKPSYGGSSPFFSDLDVQHMVDWCSMVFGIKGMKPNTDETNRRYGGNQHLYATNVVITQGALDPWHNLGIDRNYTGPTQSVNSILYSAGHCAPLHQSTKKDPADLVFSRIFVGNHIKKYLKEG